MIVDGNATKPGYLMQWLDYVVQQLIYVKNVVHGYTGATKNACDSVLTLLWNPAKLIECETKYPSVFLTNPATAREYEKFNEEISKPFQEKALRLMTAINVRTHSLYFESA